MTCSHSSCVPKARTPNTCVTVLASQPSVSMETDTTQRIDSPNRSGLPTVFITSRSNSWSERFSAWRRSAGTFDNLAAEACDLICRHSPKIGVQGVAGFELLAVDEEGTRTRQLSPRPPS